MPWKEMSVMSQRREFVELAQAEGTNKEGPLPWLWDQPYDWIQMVWAVRRRERGRPGRSAAAASLFACTHPSAG